MNKQEYIDTAQALEKIPGTEKFPWVLVETIGIKRGGKKLEIRSRRKTARKRDKKLDVWVFGSWLSVNDSRPMSAAKFLGRVGVVVSIGDLHGCFPGGGVIFEDWPANPYELDYNQAILTIGQKAQTEGGVWLEAWNRGMNVGN